MSVIFFLYVIDIADENWFYFPGVFMAALFIRAWLSPISKFELNIATREALAFPLLIRLT